MGPEKVPSPAKDMIMAEPENTAFYKIMNVEEDELDSYDYWILAKNLTPEEKKQMEDLSKDPKIKKKKG